jgi:hypothetical protein
MDGDRSDVLLLISIELMLASVEHDVWHLRSRETRSLLDHGKRLPVNDMVYARFICLHGVMRQDVRCARGRIRVNRGLGKIGTYHQHGYFWIIVPNLESILYLFLDNFVQSKYNFVRSPKPEKTRFFYSRDGDIYLQHGH